MNTAVILAILSVIFFPAFLATSLLKIAKQTAPNFGSPAQGALCKTTLGETIVEFKPVSGGYLDSQICQKLIEKARGELLVQQLIDIKSKQIREHWEVQNEQRLKIEAATEKIYVNRSKVGSARLKDWEMYTEENCQNQQNGKCVLLTESQPVNGEVLIPISQLPPQMNNNAGDIKVWLTASYLISISLTTTPQQSFSSSNQETEKNNLASGDQVIMNVTVSKNQSYDLRCFTPNFCSVESTCNELRLSWQKLNCPNDLVCCFNGPTQPSVTPISITTITPTANPTQPLLPTRIPSPTSTPTPRTGYGNCGIDNDKDPCYWDDSVTKINSCTPWSECHVVYNEDECRRNSDNKFGYGCCLQDKCGCNPSACSISCGYRDNNVICNACEKFINHSPWCEWDDKCGNKSPFPPRLKTEDGKAISLGEGLKLSWFAYGEGAGDNCGVQADNIANPTFGNCWGYVCAQRTFGIPNNWRYYSIFVKGPNDIDFQKKQKINNIPNPKIYGQGLGDSYASYTLTPDISGIYEWYVRAGYNPGTGYQEGFSDSAHRTFTVTGSPTWTPTPVSTDTPTPTPTITQQGTCEYCRAYDENWNQIIDLSSLRLNQKVFLTTKGNLTNNLKARFRINGTADGSWCNSSFNNWCETDLKYNDMYYIPYVFTTAGRFIIESMILNINGGWY